ncbi:hypothetical protein PGTUg99_031819 [Puccinia graminis f. sp. tritici]|uniref:Uncharacterized protein n=1 Tax=Puccinia graminis f. sp. tritici TaxID=56615 RepID=A0A5B0SF72_PUCGR|nr:hypothetical protein PGTUg99_031819 [Puccinia graminis f. sp. tritici]
MALFLRTQLSIFPSKFVVIGDHKSHNVYAVGVGQVFEALHDQDHPQALEVRCMGQMSLNSSRNIYTNSLFLVEISTNHRIRIQEYFLLGWLKVNIGSIKA